MKLKFLFIFIIGLGLGACQEDEGQIGEPMSKVEGLTATEWVISKVTIIDGASPSKEQRDFSDFYLNGESKLRINFSEDGTFNVSPGTGLNFLPDDGAWSFDDQDAPRKIILDAGDQSFDVNLQAPTRIVDQELKLRLDKYSCVLDGELTPVYSYLLIFQRVQ